MTERRYTDEEVAEIIARATEAQQGMQTRAGAAAGSGLTLAELQDIGREVGIAPELLQRAAITVDHRVESSSRRFLGLPIAVVESAHLGRTITDDEWQRVVGDLRMTFNATGRVRQDGDFRQWSNGNLRAILEPTERGHRVRLQTMKGDSRAYMIAGLGMIGLAGLLGVSALLFPDGTMTLPKASEIGLMGAAAVTIGAIQLPGWARRRRAQMQALIARLTAPRGNASA